tara:strand:+ start:90 stop:296 length:207 start_codon:yes stop_codon:yes gene_type:complete
MSDRAKRLETEYLKQMHALLKTTHDKKSKIGVRSLGGFVRALVDECPSMNLKTAKELFQIAEELEELS